MALFAGVLSHSARLGCFGKLPSYGDFLSLNADGPEAEALVHWLQEGVAKMPLGAPPPVDASLSFLWRPRDARRFLVGAAWPSADSAGRRFPFALFYPLQAAALAQHGPRKVVAVEPAWRALQEIRMRIDAAPPGAAACYEVLREASPPPVLPPHDAAEQFAVRSRAAAFDPAAAPGLALLVRDLSRLAAEFSKQDDVPEFAMRLRLRAAADAVGELTVLFQMLAQQLGAQDLDAAVFLRTSRADRFASAFLFHRPLVASDLPFLLAPDLPYRLADSLGQREVPTTPEELAYRAAFEQRWNAGPRSFAALAETALHDGSLVANPAAPAPSPPTAAVHSPVPGRPDDGPLTATNPIPVAPRNDDEITAEIVPETTDATIPPVPAVAGATARDAATGDVATNGAASGETPVVQPTTSEPTVTDSVSNLALRIRALAAGSLLPGRLVRVSRAAPTPGAPPTVSSDLVVYVEDGVAVGRALLPHELMGGVFDHQSRSHAQARRLLEDLRRRNREEEDRLAAEIERACKRARRPGPTQ